MWTVYLICYFSRIMDSPSTHPAELPIAYFQSSRYLLSLSILRSALLINFCFSSPHEYSQNMLLYSGHRFLSFNTIISPELRPGVPSSCGSRLPRVWTKPCLSRWACLYNYSEWLPWKSRKVWKKASGSLWDCWSRTASEILTQLYYSECANFMSSALHRIAAILMCWS